MKNGNFKKLIVLLIILVLFTGSISVHAKNKKVVKIKTIPQTSLSRTVKKEEISGINISLSVLGNNYQTKVKSGSTVYDTMINLQNTKENNFSFVSKNYSGLGSFIEEINGVKGIPGKYWLYYLNGKKASLGVSKNILKNGDKIEWKQESF